MHPSGCLARRVFRPACTALLLAGYGAILALCGADLAAGVRFWLAALFWLWLPGRALAARLAPRRGRGLYAAIYGAGLLAAVQCLAARLGAFWLLGLPAAVGLARLLRPIRRSRGSTRALARRAAARAVHWLTGPHTTLWAGLCLGYGVFCSAANPHPLRAGAAALDRDFLWNIGNAAALQRAFPAEDLRVSGVRLTYHYLTELLWAALARLSGAALFDVYFYFAGPVFLALALAALQALARGCWPGRRPTGRYLALVFGFGCASGAAALGNGLSVFGNTLLAHLLTNVNAQATALPFFAGAFCAFAALARAGLRRAPGSWRQWGALFLSFGLLCVAKGPQAALLLCGVAAALALLLLLRRVRFGPAAGMLAGLGAVFFALYQFLYAGGVSSMEFSIFAMRNTFIYRTLSPLTDALCAMLPGTGYFWLVCLGLLNVFCMLPLQCLLCLGLLPAAVRALPRPDPARLLAAALAGGGMLAYHLFYHSSSSQVYFALLALLCLSLLAAGAPRPRGVLRGPVLLAGMLGGLTTLCIALGFARQAAPPLAACAGLREPAASAENVTAGDEAAMAWLAANSSERDVFATNRISSTPAVEDAISNIYTGLSGQQAWLEGWTYAVTNMGVGPDFLAEKRWVNEELFSGLPTGEARALARQAGVRWLVLAKVWPGAPPAGLAPVYENESAAIYDLEDSAAGG